MRAKETLVRAAKTLRIESQTKFVIYLLNNTSLSNDQIADTVEVPLSFVNQVKESQVK